MKGFWNTAKSKQSMIEYTKGDSKMSKEDRTISFSIEDMVFEYDEAKNQANIKKHHVSFKAAARVFFDRNRIELYDEENSIFEDRFDTIGNAAIGMTGTTCDILFVVYTDRVRQMVDGVIIDVTRIISARYATEFERGLYYGKIND